MHVEDGMREMGQEQLHNISPQAIQKNMLWNVAGSVGFIGAQWMMTILIVHLAGYTEAGYLSLGLSLTNLFTNIAYFCIRNYQVSDGAGKYSADLYVTHRVVAAFVAFTLYTLFVLANGYSLYVTAFLLLFMVYRLHEPVVDVFHGIDQKAWRLDLAGQSFLLRGLFTLAAFVLVEKLTGNLVLTTLVMAGIAYGVIWLFDIPGARRCTAFSLQFDRERLLSLTRECFPLFLYALCLNAVVPIPRYFLEKLSGSEVLGFYSSVAIPASVVQLLSSYVFTTFTALFADYAARKAKKPFMALFLKLGAAVILLIALALGGSALLGEWALVLLFTESIRAYAYLLMPTILCCGLIALIWFVGTVLTVLRDRMGLLFGAAAGMAVSAVSSFPCIRTWGVDGVNVALFLSSIVTLGIYLVRFGQAVKKWE